MFTIELSRIIYKACAFKTSYSVRFVCSYFLFFVLRKGHLNRSVFHTPAISMFICSANASRLSQPFVHASMTHVSAIRLLLFSAFWSSPRPISNSQLHTLLYFHLCPIYLVLFKGSYNLLIGKSHLEGGFTLRCLQRLSLPDLATLPCRWSATDTPVVRPSRSSRTKDSSSQISSARAG